METVKRIETACPIQQTEKREGESRGTFARRRRERSPTCGLRSVWRQLEQINLLFVDDY